MQACSYLCARQQTLLFFNISQQEIALHYTMQDQSKHTAYLLMNLGSPDSTSVPDVRRYLNQFLMDERVIDKPYLSRLLLVKGIITPFRAPKSAEAYETIWTDEGSPLIVLTEQLRAAVEQELQAPVEMCMRYGNPDTRAAFEKLLARVPGLTRVVAIPLYPHYAMSSFETAVEAVKEEHARGKYAFSLQFAEPYYNDAGYIDALAQTIAPFLETDYDHILFSYHGVPVRHLQKSDPTQVHCYKVADCCTTPSPAHKTCYKHQCVVTTQLVTEKLGIQKDQYSISFQSRLGKGWVEPFTDVVLEEMPKKGIKKLLILCPAFVSDCLETLEEIAMRGRETFLEAGGEEYAMIPCINVHPAWVSALANICKRTNEA